MVLSLCYVVLTFNSLFSSWVLTSSSRSWVLMSNKVRLCRDYFSFSCWESETERSEIFSCNFLISLD